MSRKGWTLTLLLAATFSVMDASGAVAQQPRRTQPAPAGAGGSRPAPSTGAAGATAPRTRPAGAAAAAAPDPRLASQMKALLREWEKKSSTLRTLDVGIDRIDKSKAWGEEEFRGRAMLESPNLALLDFQRKVENPKQGQPEFVSKERIVCTGREVWQYLTDTKQIFIFPLDRQNQRQVLEEGPLPFLFNMKAAEAEARYEMTLVPGDLDPKNHIISVVPRLKVDREAFSKAYVSLSKERFIPNRIMLISPDGESTKDFKLRNIRENVTIDHENFKGRTVPKWSVVRDPAGSGSAQPPNVGNAAPAGNRPPRR